MDIAFQDIASLEVFSEFQRLVRRLFGLTLSLVSPDFSDSRLFGPRSEMNPFCLALQSTAEGARRCRECDRHVIGATAHGALPARYQCHAGLSEFAIPIRVNHRVVAVLQCGQVLDSKPTADGWKNTLRRLKGWKGDCSALEEKWRRTRVLPPGVQEDVVALLRLFAEHVVTAYGRLRLLDKAKNQSAVHRAQSFITANFASPLPLAAVARAAGTSPRNLTRLFLAETGRTVLDFIHEARLHEACELLALTPKKAAEVAFACGFGSVQQFNRLFRQSRQCTPLAWREKIGKPTRTS
ncbi:MAG: PocR ligand-binding domain-containing protein [Verrucomicrobiota bacterium]